MVLSSSLKSPLLSGAMVTALVMHVDVARELKVPFAVVTALVMHVDVAREGYYTSACFSGM